MRSQARGHSEASNAWLTDHKMFECSIAFP